MTEAFTDAIRDVIRDELAGLSVSTFARVKAVNDADQRVTVELKNNPAWVDDNVPLVAPNAADGSGDIPGVTPGDEVLVVFSADDTGALTGRRGPTPDADREDAHGNAIALPLGAYTDADDVPDHEPGERIISHENGAMIRMGPTGTDDLRIEHPSGMEIKLNSDPATTAENDTAGDTPRDSPPTTEGVAELKHPTGVGVTVSTDGISITPGATDGAPEGGYGYDAYNNGTYGGGGKQQGVTSHSKQNDPWRVELAGDSRTREEEGHRHLIPRGDGTYAITGPPLPNRRLFEWFANRYEELENTGYGTDRGQGFYRNWLRWLEQQTGETHDPDLTGGDTTTDWPYPEPVPDPEDREQFHEDGFGMGGFDDHAYGE